MANPPFVPSAWYKVENMVELARPTPGQKMVDLGSGDGRILIAFAKRGVEAHGYELNPDLVLKADTKINELGLGNKITIHQEDFWDVDISDYDIVTVFGMTSIMSRLRHKFQTQLRPGTKILSNTFEIPNWKEKDVRDHVYLYIKR